MRVTPEIEIENMGDPSGRRSLSMVEEFATIGLPNGRKVELVRSITGLGFEVRYSRDDPKHPGGQFAFGIKPLIDAVMKELEGEG